MSDLIAFAMKQAARDFGGDDGVFNAAGFSDAFTRLSRTKSPLDGRVVEVMLWGRPDVDQLSGGSHYKLRQNGG